MTEQIDCGCGLGDACPLGTTPAAAPTPVEPRCLDCGVLLEFFNDRWLAFAALGSRAICPKTQKPHRPAAPAESQGRPAPTQIAAKRYYDRQKEQIAAESQGVERAQPECGCPDWFIQEDDSPHHAICPLYRHRAQAYYPRAQPVEGPREPCAHEAVKQEDRLECPKCGLMLARYTAAVEGVERVTDDAPARVEPEPDWKRYEFIDRKDCRCPCHSEMLPAKHIIPCCQERPDAQPAKHTDDRPAETQQEPCVALGNPGWCNTHRCFRSTCREAGRWPAETIPDDLKERYEAAKSYLERTKNENDWGECTWEVRGGEQEAIEFIERTGRAETRIEVLEAALRGIPSHEAWDGPQCICNGSAPGTSGYRHHWSWCKAVRAALAAPSGEKEKS